MEEYDWKREGRERGYGRDGMRLSDKDRVKVKWGEVWGKIYKRKCYI
jgi:hypothetical protein